MDLYALPPEEFTAARDAAAKADKTLKALRKPTVSAWVVNTLVRRDGALLDQLLELGAELAAAQVGRDAAALRTLTEQRKQLVAAVTRRASELALRALTTAATEEVRQTLDAALADPACAAAVRTGQLVRPLAFAGFGGVDLEGAVADLPVSGLAAKPISPPTKKAATNQAQPPTPLEPSKRIQKLEAAALEAIGVLDDAVRLAERTTRELGAAEQALADRQQLLEADTARLEQTRSALVEAETAHALAASERLAAHQQAQTLRAKAERTSTRVAAAQQKADAARQALDAARRS